MILNAMILKYMHIISIIADELALNKRIFSNNFHTNVLVINICKYIVRSLLFNKCGNNAYI